MADEIPPLPIPEWEKKFIDWHLKKEPFHDERIPLNHDPAGITRILERSNGVADENASANYEFAGAEYLKHNAGGTETAMLLIVAGGDKRLMNRAVGKVLETAGDSPSPYHVLTRATQRLIETKRLVETKPLNPVKQNQVELDPETALVEQAGQAMKEVMNSPELGHNGTARLAEAKGARVFTRRSEIQETPGTNGHPRRP